ncbi:hypothetical protein BH10BDE1_BH10BDE1_22250 [soil metagenome]
MIAFLKMSVYSLLTQFALVLIAFYRAVGSLWLSGSCRFEPSCSVYGQEAIERYGIWVGGRLAVERLCRCRPGGSFGYDPVPQTVAHECEPQSEPQIFVLKKECE